jgi:tRNA pseudouridine38-40 synthase
MFPSTSHARSGERTICIIVEYDGTAYLGWQRQRGGPTIQERLEAAIEAVTSQRTVVHGSGRTDAGVHASGQVAHFRTRSRLPADVLQRAINAHLPLDIVVLAARDAPEGFHARFDACSKVYRYCIRNSAVRGALDRHIAWQVPWRLNVAAMTRAARLLLGRRDLRSFVAEGSSVRDTVRTIKRLDIRRSPPYILVTVEADGFLYKVVRTIVGTLVWVGSGKIDAEAFREILESGDRRRAGPTVPPKGLTLLSVAYPSASGSRRDRSGARRVRARRPDSAANSSASRTPRSLG